MRRPGDHAERRLHCGEGRDDFAPDVFDRGERQPALMPRDKATHHVGLAVGAEGGARLAGPLDLDQLRYDARAVDQKPVHGLVDRIDAVADRLQRIGRRLVHPTLVVGSPIGSGKRPRP